jgi:hypothetical protein
MKKLAALMFVALILVNAAWSQAPSQQTEKAIDEYLKALKDSNQNVRMNALKQLNDLKTLYPKHQMKEFETFLSSSIMQKSTNSWIANLGAENAGVRHATLYALVRLKSDFPQLDMSVFNAALNKAVNKDPVAHIQVDAKIASIYLSDAKLASAVKVDENAAPGDVFAHIHVEMDKMFHKEFSLAE